MGSRPPRPSVRPAGVVAFLLTDIEGSTRMWQHHPQVMRETIRRHDSILSEQIKANGGRVLTEHGEGDSFFAVFPRATQALAAARDIQLALLREPWPAETPVKVRMAINAGEAVGDFRGMAANRSARIRSLGKGGQVLVSQTVESLVRDELPAGVQLEYFGMHALRDVASSERVYEAVIDGLPRSVQPAAPARRRARRWWALVPAAAAAVVVALIISQVLQHKASPAPPPRAAATAEALDLLHLRIKTIAGSGVADYIPAPVATDAALNHPTGLAVGPDGSLYIADTGNDRIRVLRRDGTLSDVVGGGSDLQAAGQQAVSIALSRPTGIGFDGDGNLYVADTGHNRVLRVDRSQHVYPFAGNGKAGDTGNNGLAVDAELTAPTGVAVVGEGCGTHLQPAPCVYIVDGGGQERFVDLLFGTIKIGTVQTKGPAGVAVTAIGPIFAEGPTNKVEIDTDFHIQPIAGTGAKGSAGDGGDGTKAQLSDPLGVDGSDLSHILIADTGNNEIRWVDYSTGKIATIAGSGADGFSGDGGPALRAALSGPSGIVVGPGGVIYIADTGNNRIRELIS